MSLELNLSFPTINIVTVSLENQTTVVHPFVMPLTTEDWEDMQWYLEVYATQYAADVDDDRAEQVVDKLRIWGQSLFHKVFEDRSARQLFNAFQNTEVEERQISISTNQPEILRLPWELLCDPNGTFLLHGDHQISMRRQFAEPEGGRSPIEVQPKKILRLLMVISRPRGTGFIDPRTESQAVLKAVEQSAPGKIVMEFLRIPTLSKLVERLEDSHLPTIDILHFDGHGFLGQPIENQYVLKIVAEPPTVINQSPITAKSTDILKLSDRKSPISYLLFEDDNGNQDPISALTLGNVLYQQHISLVVLSACYSGTATGDDALGCTATLLTHQGIPAVLSMTDVVLATTTEQFFSKFYGEIALGKSIGRSVTLARQDLAQRQQRGLRWRGKEQINLELADWFLPAWYQAGKDIVLLKQDPTSSFINLPPPRIIQSSKIYTSPTPATEGFFGRSRELWLIERAFVRGGRKFTISGFGGQGKTYLALEAGRWLCQTGMFDVLCFVDYASFQGVEPVDWAIAELSVLLKQSFIDAEAVKLGLQKQRTLVILDSLESLQPNALYGLLTVASEWSEVGETRLLLTTRDRELNHPDYSIGRHEYLLLKGLGSEEYPEDAINYFQGLMKLPPVPQWKLPDRQVLLELLKLVDFHPLSIRLLALQSKERRIGDFAGSLELLLAEGFPDQDKQRSLVASLNLSLQRLDPDQLVFLPKLGVFQGGALEDAILAVTEIETKQWVDLKSALVRTGLVQVEEIGKPFLRFHPTLASVLWRQLTAKEQRELRLKHQKFFHTLVSYLYDLDSQNPEVARIIAKRELPNLLRAVKGALADQSENAVSFVDRINRFLDIFGLKRDREYLTEQLHNLVNTVGSNNWYLVRSNQGEQLFNAGQFAAAAEIFTEILQLLGAKPSFNGVKTLGFLGRCFNHQGQLVKALEYLQAAISLAKQLEQSNNVKRQQGILLGHLGNALSDLGQYSAAQQAYENSLEIEQELGDQRGLAIAQGQLGTLAMLQGDLTAAERKYQSALQTFQKLQEPHMEAVAWHQLGMVYQEGQQWTAADRAYRESANIQEQQGNLTGAASTYGQLAILSSQINKLAEAEAWYHKALQNSRKVGDRRGESKRLHNLAYLLANQPNRLSEAQQLAIEALAIDQTLDPAAAEIWRTYNLLAKIATAQGETQQAQAYRQQARLAKAAFAGTQFELQKHEPLIAAVVTAVADHSAEEELETLLTQRSENGWEQLVTAIRRILAEERSIEALWDDLDADDFMIIQTIIDRLVFLEFNADINNLDAIKDTQFAE